MAEGGGEFGDGDLIHFHDIDHDDDDDDQEVNRTQPFQPGAASTPYHGGEQIEMQTMTLEQSGLLDTSYAETPLLGDFMHPEEKQTFIERTKEYIKGHFPKVDFSKLGPISIGKKGATQGEMVVLGSKGGEAQIFKKDGSGFLKSFTDRFTKTLGPTAEQIIAEDRDTLQEQRQILAEAEKQEQEAIKIAAEREKELQEIKNLKQKIDRVQARIDALQEEHGSNVESEAELQRQKQLKKNYQTEYENIKKKWPRLKSKKKNKRSQRKGCNRKSETRRNYEKKKKNRRAT